MTPSDQLLYTTCEYGIDNNGVPYRRGEDEKDTPLPGGCETTLLLSSTELLKYFRHMRKARRKLRLESGESCLASRGGGNLGDFSDRGDDDPSSESGSELH
eukprot:TRINITY_DN23470_c0_g1_i1.p1 TRINITY_DN23470_c0_g1~~TRINITY_DN23470_c0_g1_i1.p1  ORF type:complete len:101 (+),score=5.33 TRINITY_DN23470_c0_g1_i1:154-456(+)